MRTAFRATGPHQAVSPQTAPLFRPMSEEDLARVLAVEQAGHEYPWTPGIFRDSLRAGYCCWVAENPARRITGFGVMSVAVGEANLLNLCVHPEYQRQGLGRAMLQHLMEIARSHGADNMFLEVRASNLAAYRLYHAMGFNEVGMRRRYYPAKQGREDALILALSLAAQA